MKQHYSTMFKPLRKPANPLRRSTTLLGEHVKNQELSGAGWIYSGCCPALCAWKVCCLCAWMGWLNHFCKGRTRTSWITRTSTIKAFRAYEPSQRSQRTNYWKVFAQLEIWVAWRPREEVSILVKFYSPVTRWLWDLVQLRWTIRLENSDKGRGETFARQFRQIWGVFENKPKFIHQPLLWPLQAVQLAKADALCDYE